MRIRDAMPTRSEMITVALSGLLAAAAALAVSGWLGP